MKNSGFTLVELLIVISIICILVSVVVGDYTDETKTVRINCSSQGSPQALTGNYNPQDVQMFDNGMISVSGAFIAPNLCTVSGYEGSVLSVDDNSPTVKTISGSRPAYGWSD